MNLTKEEQNKLIAFYPELRSFFDMQENGNLIKTLIGALASIKGDKGEKGDPGYSPIKGKDYFTDQELNNIVQYILRNSTPVKGKDYSDGEKGDKGDDYVLTKKDKIEIASKIEVPIVEKIIEKPFEILPKDIAKRLNTLKDSIDISVIKGATSKEDFEKASKRLDEMSNTINPKGKIDQRWHGSGLSKVSTDSTLKGNGTPASPLSVVSAGGVTQIIAGSGISISPITGTGTVTITSTGGGGGGSFSPIAVSGTINDTNTSFTATSQPSLLNINGLLYQQTGGSITWSYSGGTITISSPVGTGGSIFGIGGLSPITISGTINDSNVTFTATSQPTFLIINGSMYQQSGGAITWSYSGGTITLSSPVGTGGSIFGL